LISSGNIKKREKAILLEIIGTTVLLAGIVWMIYRYYGTPESEYLHVLEGLAVDDYSHLETAAIKEQIDTTRQELKKLDEHMRGNKKKKVGKRQHIQHRLETIKLSLLTYELDKREYRQEEKS